ncbi:MAG: arginine--tRNA ligase [Oscillospiraceae bacterium]
MGQGTVSVSDRQDLCQFQCNGAFAGAKQYRKAPLVIAQEVAAVLQQNPIFEKAEVCRPGFLNLTLTDACFLEHIGAIASDEHLGIPQEGQGKTIVLDYGGPNLAKPLHIGHLRSAIIGEALKRLARACGYRVVSDVHLGDWGLQIGLVIAELSERYPQWPCFQEGFDPQRDEIPTLDADTLNEIYPFASKKSKEDEQFKAKAQRITAQLQSRDPAYIALWQAILKVSVADLKKNYSRLNVDFDLWYGESDSDGYIDELVGILRDKGLMYLSEGAMVVDVAQEDDKAPVPPVIIKKSDNSNIYATTDLATILQRQKDFAPDKIWYVVDKRQGLHFTQVFRCAAVPTVPDSTELQLLGIGTMNGSDGKPYKTRDGGVMRLSDLIDTVTQSALEKIEASPFVDGEHKEELAQRIGVAAIKFGDLINHWSRDYCFDMEKFLSFEERNLSVVYGDQNQFDPSQGGALPGCAGEDRGDIRPGGTGLLFRFDHPGLPARSEKPHYGATRHHWPPSQGL